MTQQISMKSRALGKDEVMLLLDIITKHKVITSKATNATNNKLKDDAWKSIAQEFSAMAGEMRRPEQLRLKWENLKKAARKRSALIRQNNLKTGGGKMYIPPDEVLDRVASTLGATCSGFTVEFGGDGERETIPQNSTEAIVKVLDFGPEQSQSEKDSSILVVGGDGSSLCGEGLQPLQANFTPKIFIFNTPKNSLNKRRKLSEEAQRAKRDKDVALAAYFQAKAEKINLENIKLKLEIEQLKLSVSESVVTSENSV